MEYRIRDQRDDNEFQRQLDNVREDVETGTDPGTGTDAEDIVNIIRDSRIGSRSYNNGEKYLLGYEGDELVAMASLKTNEDPRELDEPAVEINHLVVEDGYRGEGRGSTTFERIIDEAVEEADDQGIDWLYGQVSSYSEPTQHLFEQYGFDVVDSTFFNDFYACAIENLEED